MLKHRLYYELKPYLPWRLRMSLRRASALRKREAFKGVWPINESAGRPPDDWPGWPEGKKFAFVLTHDVEGLEGLAKCRDLMKLEMDLGFRSSFNFIPEGDYIVPPELRAELTRNGFEVGVQDLHHDGKLYWSRRDFAEKAVWINRYLKDWGAVGFRPGFMFHNLDWHHDLEILYDASTFDTDPFEPQPDGVNTIFPFWVPRPITDHESLVTSHSALRPGYVELPYTLPQDSTLFLLFQESSPDVWKRKLDWIARHGGMALVISHPDYMSFGGKPNGRSDHEYQVELYGEFLTHVSREYEGQYWHTLPREVASYARSMFVGGAPTVVGAPEPSQPQSKDASQADRTTKGKGFVAAVPEPALERTGAARRVLMLVENFFPQDTRVCNEALLLSSAGYRVSVLCYRKKSQPSFEKFNGIDVYRIPRIELFQKTPSGEASAWGRLFLRLKSAVGYLVEYAYFTGMCLLGSVRIYFKSGFDVIHVHNPPDTLFLVGLPFKLIGKKFVFDHHDLCPELYQSRYGTQRGFYTALLTILEWCSLRLADVTIATNETYKETQIQRAGKRAEHIFVVRNGPNQDRMQPRTPSERLRRLNKKTLCYIGSLNPQDGVDYLLRSLNHLLHDLRRDDFYCVIMGSGDSLDDLRALAKELKLEGHVELTGFIPDQDLMENLAAADICVDPDPSSPLNDVSTWIKIMEYMACGKPIVSFDLKETRLSAQDAALYVPPNDELAFAKAIAKLMDDPGLRQKMGSFGRQRVERELQWSVTGKNLLAAYKFLFP